MRKFKLLILSLLLLIVTVGCDLISLSNIVSKRDNYSVNFFMINDTHGIFVDEQEFPGMGRVSSLINELESNNKDYIKIANGDIFQGTYISATLYGKPLVDSLNQMDFDAFVLGNHEFDWGLDKIAVYKDGNESNGEANFPFLGANIIDKSDNEIVDWVEPYVIVEYDGFKVGVIGVMGSDQESSIIKKHVENYDFIDTVPVVEKYSKELRTDKDCDVVVVATHDYSEYDNFEYAELSGDSRVDAIFCAHTHRYINDNLTRSDGKRIPVVQNNDKNENAVGVTLNYNSEFEYINYKTNFYNPMNYSLDSNFYSLIEKYESYLEKGSEVVTNLSWYLSKSTLGEYMVDAMNKNYGTDFAIMNKGGVRATIDSGKVTISSVFAAFPFDNTTLILELKGSDIKYFYNRYGSSMYCSENPSSFDDNKIYKVSVVDYVYFGGYVVFYDKEYVDSEVFIRDILIDYLKNK